MMNINNADTCYMCKKIATTIEHVPPRCLFPKQKDLDSGIDLRKQLITVPSCAKHNVETSKDDEYLQYAVLMSLANNETAKNHFNTKILRAIERNPSVISLFLKRQIPVIARDSTSGKSFNTLALMVDENRIKKTLDKIGRALHFHHFNSKWFGSISVIPNFILSLKDESTFDRNSVIHKVDQDANELFSIQPCYGQNPEVFFYQVKTLTEGSSKIMRLHFYEGARFMLIFQ